MADAVTSTTLMDSDRVAIIQLTSTSDGTGEAAVKKIDVSALSDSSTGQACTGVRLARIVYSTFGMSVKLLWDATTDTICWDLNADYTTDEDFTEFEDAPLPNEVVHATFCGTQDNHLSRLSVGVRH